MLKTKSDSYKKVSTFVQFLDPSQHITDSGRQVDCTKGLGIFLLLIYTIFVVFASELFMPLSLTQVLNSAPVPLFGNLTNTEEVRIRARNKKGHYVADDKSTPDVNEAWTTKRVKKSAKK